MDKISFIIPAYNAAETIDRTVSSIEALKLNKEILIVENGSTDNTEEISIDLTDRYDNIRFLTSEKGVSKARNKGIEQATGEWIVFVDADDECLRGIEKILGIIATPELNERTVLSNPPEHCQPDVIIGSYKKDDESIIHDYQQINTLIETSDKLKAWMISKPTLRMQAWAKVYRTDFLKAHHLFFNESLTYSEDSEFVIRVLERLGKVMISDIPVYQYHSGTASAMRGFVDGRIKAYIKALEVAEKDVESESLVVKNAFVDYVIAHINIIGVHDIFGCEIKESWKNRCRKMRMLLTESVIERSVKNMRFSLNLQLFPVMLCKRYLTVLGGGIYYVRSLQNRKRYQRARIDHHSGLSD